MALSPSSRALVRQAYSSCRLTGWYSDMLDYSLETMTDLDRKLVLTRGDVDLAESTAIAREVVDAVRAGGDAALREFAERFDGFKGGPLTVPEEEIEESIRTVGKEVVDALKLSKRRI